MNKTDKYLASLQNGNKTVIVTGANSGLGYQISKTVLLKGGTVVMACRNLEKAKKAKESLVEETGSDRVLIESYDQSSLKSVYNFINIIKTKYSHFDSLVLNAGIYRPKEKVDEFHVSTVYRTNFIGLLALLTELKPFLDETEKEKRIIIQGSLSSFLYKYKKKDKFIYGTFGPFKQYSLSKLCCTNAFAFFRDNNHNPYVKYLLCEPGIANTNIYQNYPKWVRVLAPLFIGIFANDAKKGSLSACKGCNARAGARTRSTCNAVLRATTCAPRPGSDRFRADAGP